MQDAPRHDHDEQVQDHDRDHDGSDRQLALEFGTERQEDDERRYATARIPLSNSLTATVAIPELISDMA